MEQGDLCYVPQGALMIKRDREGMTYLPIGTHKTERPMNVLVLDDHGNHPHRSVLFQGERWTVLKRESYPVEENDAR